jgi:hypothetical protein
MTLILIYVSADRWITQQSHSVRSDPSDIERETVGRCKVRQDTRLPLAATDRRTLFRALVRTSLPCFGSSLAHRLRILERGGLRSFARDLVVRSLQKSDP